MVTTRDTFHFEISPLKELALSNIDAMLTTFDTSHFEMSPLKEFASINIDDVSMTFDTSHAEISPSNVFAPKKVAVMMVTSDTSHVAIGPCGPSEQSAFEDILRQKTEQSAFEDILRHASTASWSFSFDCGEKVGVPVDCMAFGACSCDENTGVLVVHTEPNEPINMRPLIAFELNQAAPQRFC